MKKLTILLIAITFLSLSASSQRLISPKLPPFVLNPLPGYVNITEMNYGFGLGDTDVEYSQFIAGITTVNGYQVNRYFLVGAGTGVFFYNEAYSVPLYLSSRVSYPVINRMLVPYLNADGGVLLSFEDFNGGTRLFVNPLLGARYTMSQTMAINLGIGLFTQMGPGTHRDSFINFKLGVMWLPKK